MVVGKATHIVIVDLYERDENELIKILHEDGYEVSIADSYGKLVYFLEEEEETGLILMRYKDDMAKELFLRIRSEERFSGIPFICVYDEEEKDIFDSNLLLGVEGNIVEPIHKIQLLYLIDEVVELSMLREKVVNLEVAIDNKNIHIDNLMRELKVKIEEVGEIRDRLSRVDVLDKNTGLFNRSYAFEQLDMAISRFNRKGVESAVILCDIDNFKEINALHGQVIGDRILKECGSVLSIQKRQQDIIARYAGDTFIIILPDTNTEGAKFFANRARLNIQKEKFGADKEVHVTVTMGVAVYDKTMPFDMLLQMAEDALSFGKDAGKNMACIANELMATW